MTCLPLPPLPAVQLTCLLLALASALTHTPSISPTIHCLHQAAARCAHAHAGCGHGAACLAGRPILHRQVGGLGATSLRRFSQLSPWHCEGCEKPPPAVRNSLLCDRTPPAMCPSAHSSVPQVPGQAQGCSPAPAPAARPVPFGHQGGAEQRGRGGGGGQVRCRHCGYVELPRKWLLAVSLQL